MQHHICICRILNVAILCSVIFLAGSCSSSSDSTSPVTKKQCGIQPGRYLYRYHYQAIEGQPPLPAGPDSGALGMLYMEETTDGFSFIGGPYDAYEVEFICIDEESASVKIQLNNRCSGRTYITNAISTSRAEEPMTIVPYTMRWTCGGEESYFVTEWWYLWL